MNKELLQFMKELDALIKGQAASSVSSGEILSHFKGSKLTRQQLLLICNYLISKGIDVSDYETLKEEAQAESLANDLTAGTAPYYVGGEEEADWMEPWQDLADNAPSLDREEEERLLLLAAEDEKAREVLLEAYTQTVLTLSKSIKLQDERNRQDLFAEGLTALLEAIQSYDAGENDSFSEYAQRIILMRLHLFVSEMETENRVSAEVMDKMNRARSAYQKLSTELDREPTQEEIAAEIGISAERLKELQDSLPSGTALYSDFMDEIDTLSALSDRDYSGDGNATEEFVLTEQILKAVSSLPVLDQECFISYYGLDGSTPKKKNDIALTYGITEDMVDQCIARALEQMRRSGIDTDFFEF